MLLDSINDPTDLGKLSYEQLDALAGELVRMPVDLILAWATPAALAAKRATASIPIVFVGVGDPVGAGIANASYWVNQHIIDAVSAAGSGHLGSNLGVVELTLAVHRVFESPRDILLWDTGHQAYVHKILTGRRQG